METINLCTICEDHQDFKVPLISTFAFNGCEWWCPYCGKKGGMLGTGEEVKETPVLKQRLKKYEEFSKEYLHSIGVLNCSETKYRGAWIKPEFLPESEKKRLDKIRKKWKYKVKLK